MELVSLDDLEPTVLQDGTTRWRLSTPLGTTHVALNRYRVPTEAGFPGGLHAHMDQEEVFVVIEGEATFETMAGEVTVGPREAVRFARGEFQSGRNESAADLVALALGAPRDSVDVRIPSTCPACGFENLRLGAGGDEPTLVCPDCDAEHVPGACPECGGDDLHVTLDEGHRPVVACRDCGAAFEEPPLLD